MKETFSINKEREEDIKWLTELTNVSSEELFNLSVALLGAVVNKISNDPDTMLAYVNEKAEEYTPIDMDIFDTVRALVNANKHSK